MSQLPVIEEVLAPRTDTERRIISNHLAHIIHAGAWPYADREAKTVSATSADGTERVLSRTSFGVVARTKRGQDVSSSFVGLGPGITTERETTIRHPSQRLRRMGVRRGDRIIFGHSSEHSQVRVYRRAANGGTETLGELN